MGSKLFNPILIDSTFNVKKSSKIRFISYDGLGGDDEQLDLLLHSENGNFQTLDERFLTKKNSTEGAEEESLYIDLSNKVYHNMVTLSIGNNTPIGTSSETLLIYSKSSVQDLITFKNSSGNDVLNISKDGSDDITITSQIGSVSFNSNTTAIITSNNFNVDSNGDITNAINYNSYLINNDVDDNTNLLYCFRTDEVCSASIDQAIDGCFLMKSCRILEFNVNKSFFGYVKHMYNKISYTNNEAMTFKLQSFCQERNGYISISSPSINQQSANCSSSWEYDIDLYMFSSGKHKITQYVQGHCICTSSGQKNVGEGLTCLHFVSGYGGSSLNGFTDTPTLNTINTWYIF